MTKSNTNKRQVVHLACEKFQAETFEFLAAYQRVQEGAQCNCIEESKAFALFWTLKEAAALGKDPRLALDSDPALAAELSLRQLQWRKARLEWHQLLMRKECPEAFNDQQTQRWRDAAELAVCLGDKNEKTTERLIDFIKRRSELSQREFRLFLKTAFENKPADWRHPELDTFLMCMWPIVSRFNWTYGDVSEAVTKKFPEEQGYPFESAHDLIKHCSGLGLRTANKPRTARRHPKGNAPLLGLALEISTEADLLRRLAFLEK